MLNKLIRYYNQNRKKVWIVVLVIVFAICLLQVLNYFAKKDSNNLGGNSSTQDTAIYQPDQSLVTGGTISKKTYEKQSTLIDNFIKNCNAGKVEDAYNLISDDCKNILYPSLEYFTTNYYNLVFTEKRDYSIENWAGDTYRINMTHDLLATGKSNEGVVTQDYYTIVTENGESKLNINGFVSSEDLNKEKQDKHIQIKVIKREKYMDYEIYNVSVKNVSDKEIILDDLQNDNTIYILDNSDIKHSAYSNELIKESLTIASKGTTNLKIKFANPYIQGRKIRSMTFSKAYSEYMEKGLYAYANVRDEFSFTINL